ncbi:MAG: hypothetical protein JO021_12805 [Alphaproteobacteria bacterium]|nr:hypothetical protein [Alphaproteobacteria bacterium]
MKTYMTGFLAALLAVSAVAAQAQSPKGGDPGGTQVSVLPSAPPMLPSASLGMSLAAERASPTAWCRESPDPSNCSRRAEAEAAICRDKSDATYDACRRAIDQMHNTK